MIEMLNQYAVVTQADLYELLGFPSSMADKGFGWTQLDNVKIRKTKKGYVIDFPKMEIF